MIISQTQSPGPVSLSIEEGSLFPLLKTTSGRVIVAFTEEEQLKTLLEKDKNFDSLNSKEKKELLKRLKAIKESGYEIKKSELTLGVTDVGVPVGRTANGIFSVLTISSLTSINEQNKAGEFLIESVREAAEAIDKAMNL